MSNATTTTTTKKSPPPTRYGMLLFPGFQALDVFGALDTLNVNSLSHKMELSLVAQTLEPVSTRPPAAALTATQQQQQQQGANNTSSSFGQSVLPTHTFADAPPLDVLIVPGGMGTRAPLADAVAYIARVYPCLQYLITVCTGATLAARAGVLDGRRATTNKRAWNWATTTGPNTHWVAHARWVVDGNVWSSSGVAAGIDAVLAWMAEVYATETADGVADMIEYTRVLDADDDPFASKYNCMDVPPKNQKMTVP